MHTSFLFDGKNVDILRASRPLLGKVLIATGSSAEIYEGGDSIFRLSTDGASHAFVIQAGKQGLAVPRCLNDWGKIMPSDEYPDMDFYWLAEFEKLDEVTSDPDAFEALKQWVDAVLKHADVHENLVTDRDELDRIHAAIRTLPVTERLAPVVATMDFICQQCVQHNADLDFNESNFMLRPATGEILVTDPAHGL